MSTAPHWMKEFGSAAEFKKRYLGEFPVGPQCEKCQSYDTFWTPTQTGPHLHCNDCGYLERDAGIPEMYRKRRK